jgi:hypothetical protein
MNDIPPIGSAGEPHVTLLIASGLLLLGAVAQFVFKMAAFENEGQHYTPLSYLRLHPWNTIAVLFGAWLCLYIAFEMGECTRVTAVLIGLGCESAVAGLRKKADQKIGLQP